MGDWLAIVSLVVSVIATVFSIYATHRANVIHCHPQQEALYSDIINLLNRNMGYSSSLEKVIRIATYSGYYKDTSADEIKMKVRRYFGKKVYNQLCNILELCDRANAADSSMYELLSIYEHTQPDEYAKIREAIMTENNEHATDQELKEATDFLDNVGLCGELEQYDYREIENTISVLSNQIDEKVKVLKKLLAKKLTKR